MPVQVNLADPDYEPSDDDLRELVREAFADVRSGHRTALAAMEARISTLRAKRRQEDARLALSEAPFGAA